MGSRIQNERKFPNWRSLPDGGRLYWIDIAGRNGWRARYLKQVSAVEATLRFWQEIYDATDTLIEVHQKYPRDLGHRKEMKP